MVMEGGGGKGNTAPGAIFSCTPLATWTVWNSKFARFKQRVEFSCMKIKSAMPTEEMFTKRSGQVIFVSDQFIMS